jgi:hypothetical protein
MEQCLGFVVRTDPCGSRSFVLVVEVFAPLVVGVADHAHDVAAGV